MRILIVSALFPPDVADPASYVKTLAQELAHQHEVTVLTYGRIPETIAGVGINTIPKHLPVHRRMWHMYKALRAATKRQDVILINNAPSTEIPAWLASWRSSAHWYLIDSDRKIKYVGWRKWLHHSVKGRLQPLSVVLPLARPEKHPFRPPTEDTWAAYRGSWDEHLRNLNKNFS